MKCPICGKKTKKQNESTEDELGIATHKINYICGECHVRIKVVWQQMKNMYYVPNLKH